MTVRRTTRVDRKHLLFAGIAALLAVPMLQTTASADILDDGFSIVNTSLPGSNTCATTANVPTVLNKVITGTGAIVCNNQQAVITLTICIETSTDGSANSWVEVSCAPTQERQDAKKIENGTHSVPCGPQPLYYRTRAVGIAYSNNAGDMSYDGTSWSGRKVFGCPLV